MNKKKSIVLYICIILLFTILILLYLYGYIPIFGKIIAEVKLRNYLITEKKIEDKEYIDKIKARFDWLNSGYDFYVKNGVVIRYNYDLRLNMIYDEEVSTMLSKLADEDYKEVIKKFPKNLEFISGIWIRTNISADNYSMKVQKLNLLGVYNTDKLSEEESLKMPAKITQEIIELMGEKYNFTGIHMRYQDINGVYEISIRLSKFKKLEYQDLLDNTKKTDFPNLPAVPY